MDAQQIHLGVMAKYWDPGRVKTRLAAAIGMDRSARIHREFCRHLAAQLRRVGGRRSFVIDPAARQQEFAALLGDSWAIEFQSEGDLGQRMHAWFASPPGGALASVESTFDRAPGRSRVLIGADCPQLSAALIERAGDRLRDRDVVLVPATDGGYCLIGLRGRWRPEYEALFREMPWSRDTLLDETRRRAAESGLALTLLEEHEDVDTMDDLDRLRDALNQNAKDPAAARLAESVEKILAGSDFE